MRVGPAADCHLTYCTNIHAGEPWPEVRDNLDRLVPAVKAKVAPDRPFGVGLRLSAAAADALASPANLADLQALLADHDLYVFTLNGFPYGPFHGRPVKEQVYQPDWQEDERLRYTNALADRLAEILPDDPDIEGSISTVPCAFKPRVASEAAVARISALLVRHVAHLVALRARTGRSIALALEPEPCCYLETVAEAVAFFERSLFGAEAVAELARLTGLGKAGAEAALRRHLGVCLDLCHAAVEYEDPRACLAQLRSAGIRIVKLQISAGLRLGSVEPDAAELLRSFDDPVYLHQVVERTARGLRRYKDLPEAFAELAAGRGAREWRIHFHVPIFRADLGAFTTTQSFLDAVLALHRADPISKHLEVETYTWDVLPAAYRDEPVVDAIARELGWVLERLAA
ncbi:MAG: metabolite traffic protein EboE [Pseudomonadota bacterium]